MSNDRPQVLVTRAADQAKELVAALESRGFEAVGFPALIVRPIVIEQSEPDASNCDIAIFVSANAVRFGLEALNPGPDVSIAAIGPMTAAELSERGFPPAITSKSGHNSESLLEAEALAGSLENKAITIVRGQGGREFLRAKLEARGAAVSYLEVYARDCPDYPAERVDEIKAMLADGGISAITVMSLATYKNLEQLVGRETLAGARVVTPSHGVLKELDGNNDSITVEFSQAPDAQSVADAVARTHTHAEKSQLMTNENTPASADEALAADEATRIDEPETAITENTEAAETPSPAPVEKANRSRSWSGLLALVLALAALALSGWNFWQSRQSGDVDGSDSVADQLMAQTNQIDELRSSIENSGRTLGNLETTVAAGQSGLSELQSAVGERQDMLESLPGRVDNVESALGAMQGIAAGTRDSWLKAEAEYYLQLANAQLQLARNPVLAAYGLQLADQRIRELADPAYTPVRRAIANEMQSLSALSDHDQEGASLKLAGLADAVASLPLRNDIERAREQAKEEAAAVTKKSEEAGGLARAWSATRNVMGDLVRVRKIDESATPLMSPEAAYFLRANLQLKLDAARLSLLRGDQHSYEQSLSDCAGWIASYFDLENVAVKRALDQIAELADNELNHEFPDISESLSLMRQRKALSEPVAQ